MSVSMDAWLRHVETIQSIIYFLLLNSVRSLLFSSAVENLVKNGNKQAMDEGRPCSCGCVLSSLE